MNKLPTLFNNRITLRPIEMTDAPDMFDYAHRDNVGPRAGWTPHRTLADSEAVIQSMINSAFTESNIGVLAIVENQTMKMIGTVGMHRWDQRNNSVEIGYVLNPDYWGRGIMVEAVTMVIKWLFDNIDIYRIECGHYDFNHQSKRVIEKCGFTLEGISRKKIRLLNGGRTDLYQYGILREEYENKTLPWQNT